MDPEVPLNIAKRLDGNEGPTPGYTQHSYLPWKDHGSFSMPAPINEHSRIESTSRPASVSTVSSGSMGSGFSVETASTSMKSLSNSSEFVYSENKRTSLPLSYRKSLPSSTQNGDLVPVVISRPSQSGPEPSPQIPMPVIAELEAEPVVRLENPEVNREYMNQTVLPPGIPRTSSNMPVRGYVSPQPVSYREPRIAPQQSTPSPIFTPGHQRQSHTPIPMMGRNYNPGPVYPHTRALNQEALPIRSPSTMYNLQPQYQPYPLQQHQVQTPPLVRPQPLAPLLQEIQNVPLLYFLEGSPATSTRAYIPPTSTLTLPTRKGHVLKILQHLLRAPIILARPCVDLAVGKCAEFEELKVVVERCVEAMGIGGCVSLVPELGGAGGLLGVHVFGN